MASSATTDELNRLSSPSPLIGSIDLRRGIADGDVDEIQIGVERRRQPGSAAALLPAVALPRLVAELARSGHGVEAPETFAARRVVGVDESADRVFAAAHAHDDLVLHHERRARQLVALHRVGHLHLPQHRAAPRVERDEHGVERADEQPVVEDRHAAVEAVVLVRVLHRLLARVAPDLAAGLRVERRHGERIAAARHVHDPVHHDRCRLEDRIAGNRRGPLGLQPPDVGRVDLLQRRVMRAAVVAPEHRPVVRLLVGSGQTLVADAAGDRHAGRLRRVARPLRRQIRHEVRDFLFRQFVFVRGHQ